MDKGRFLIETHLRTHKSIKELAAAHGVSESWLFKLLARYRREGPAGLEPRSRRPKTSPTRIADLYEDEIVEWRKRLEENGLDAGAESIHFYMSTPGRNAPSISTIHRVLVARLESAPPTRQLSGTQTASGFGELASGQVSP